MFTLNFFLDVNHGIGIYIYNLKERTIYFFITLQDFQTFLTFAG